MTEEQAKLIVGALKAAFPRQPIEVSTVKVYAAFLVDFDYDVAEPAVRRLIARSRFFPTVAEIREAVAEEALGLPDELTAWELVQRAVSFREVTRDCASCRGSGFADIDCDIACGVCHGRGVERVNEPPQMPEEVRRALDYIGGVEAIRTADVMGVVRAQFRDAYRQARSASVVGKVLDAPQLAPPERVAIEMPKLKALR